MFRPDPAARPRWMGNLKRYQLIDPGTGIDLGDANGASAIDNNTGFLTTCAASYWTTDSGTYWQNVPENPPPIGKCIPAITGTPPVSIYSDIPDGPLVEKGSVAEVIRKGNNPPTTTGSWDSNAYEDPWNNVPRAFVRQA